MSNELITGHPTCAAQGAGQTQAAHGKEHNQNGNETNVIALAYYYLIESSITSSESALVEAKQLRANGLAQQKLDDEEVQLKWHDVPHLQSTRHTTTIAHHHWTKKFWKHGGFEYTTYQHKSWVTHKNQAEVNIAESLNMQVTAERQYLMQKMSVLQQIAQGKEGHVNVITDESAQTMQEGAGLLQMLQSLTFKALLRRPIQG